MNLTVKPLSHPQWDVRMQAVTYMVDSSKHGPVLAFVDTSDLDFKNGAEAVSEFNLHEGDIMRAITSALSNDRLDQSVPQGEPPLLRISSR